MKIVIQYLGATPGPAIKDCWYYNHADNTINAITSLPEPRAGGALMHSPQHNILIFTAGAGTFICPRKIPGLSNTALINKLCAHSSVRPIPGITHAVDCWNTWTYSLDQGDNGLWVSQDDIPFSGNHVMYTRAHDATGLERFYVMGGQTGEDEKFGNIKTMYEFVPSKPKGSNQQWLQRANMLVERGHASSSTRAYGCGLIMVSGTTNKPTGKIASIHYYDIPTDNWFDIGSLGVAQNTPVCDIYQDPSGQEWVWCTSPKNVYRKRKIILEY